MLLLIPAAFEKPSQPLLRWNFLNPVQATLYFGIRIPRAFPKYVPTLPIKRGGQLPL